jgi:hypothetical protein
MAKQDVEKLPVPEKKILEESKTTLTATRFKTKLAEYGMGEEYFNTFEGNIAKAASMKSDDEISEDIKTSTRLKNEKLAETATWGENVKTRLELAFANKPEVLREFPSDFTKAKHDELTMLDVVPRIINVIDKYPAELQAKGLPADHKAKGTVLVGELDTLNKNQEYLKKNRTSFTAQRIAAYMTIYNTVNEINKTGRVAYKESAADLKAFDSPWPVAEKKSDESKKGAENKSGEQK